jgi:hypothetical protein
MYYEQSTTQSQPVVVVVDVVDVSSVVVSELVS